MRWHTDMANISIYIYLYPKIWDSVDLFRAARVRTRGGRGGGSERRSSPGTSNSECSNGHACTPPPWPGPHPSPPAPAESLPLRSPGRFPARDKRHWAPPGPFVPPSPPARSRGGWVGGQVGTGRFRVASTAARTRESDGTEKPTLSTGDSRWGPNLSGRMSDSANSERLGQF